MQLFKSPVNKQSYKPQVSDLSWDWHSEAVCNLWSLVSQRKSWRSRFRNALVTCEEQLCSARNLKRFSLCDTHPQVCDRESQSKLCVAEFWKAWPFWEWLGYLLSWKCWLWPWLTCFLRNFWFLAARISINHTIHYTMFSSSYLWKLLAGLHFSFGMSYEQPLAISWVCYPCDQNTTAKGSMGHFSLCLKPWR